MDEGLNMIDATSIFLIIVSLFALDLVTLYNLSKAIERIEKLEANKPK